MDQSKNSTIMEPCQNFDEFLKKRKEWIEQNFQLRPDYDIIKQFTPKEKKVNEILQNAIEEENKRTNNKIFTGDFLYYRKEIAASPVYKMLKRFPKGCDLHVHILAYGSREFVIKKYTYMDNCYMYTRDDKNGVKGQFRFFKKGEAPDGWVLVNELRNKSGDVEKFDQELIDSIQLTDGDISERGKTTISSRWPKFIRCFDIFYDLLCYAPIYKDYFDHVVQTMIKDNTFYMELRTVIGTLYDLERRWTPEEHMKFLQELIRDAKKKYKDEFLGMKVVHLEVRHEPKDYLLQRMRDKLKYQHKYDDVLIGFDLAGLEEQGGNTLDIAKDLIEIQQEAKQQGKTFDFYFHGGETNRDTENLYDIILLGTKRIGHGYALRRHPFLMDIVRDRSICVEICPISNHILGLVNDVRNHPGLHFWNHHIPLVLCTDDPGIWQCEGLTHDFKAALMCWNLGLSGMKLLALNSIKYSAMTKDEKEHAYSIWEKKYNEFLDFVLSNYGHYLKQ